MRKRNKNIFQDYISGKNIQDMCSKYDISKQRVHQIINKLVDDKEQIMKARRNHIIRREFQYDSIEELEKYLNATRAIPTSRLAEYHNIEYSVVSEARDIFNINVRSEWTEEIIIEALRALYHEGIAMNSTNVRYYAYNLHAAISRYFDSYYDALEKAGLLFEPAMNKKDLRRTRREKEFKSELNKLYEKGINLNYRNIQLNHQYLLKRAERLYRKDAQNCKKSLWEYALEKNDYDYSLICKRSS